MDSINQAVITKLQTRAAIGEKKYGVTMDRTDLTELQWLEHAQCEALDCAVYLEKLIQLKSMETIIKPVTMDDVLGGREGCTRLHNILYTAQLNTLSTEEFFGRFNNKVSELLRLKGLGRKSILTLASIAKELNIVWEGTYQ